MFSEIKEFLEELNKAFPITKKFDGATQLPRHSLNLDDDGNIAIVIMREDKIQSLAWTEDNEVKGPKEQVAEIIEAIERAENDGII